MAVAIVAIGLDYLINVDGQSYRLGDEISASVAFGHNEIRMVVLYQWDAYAIANRTVVASYSDVYNDLCGEKNIRNENVDSSYCNDLKALESAGQTYYGFMVFALAMFIIAFCLSFIIAIARCACKKPMVIGAYIVSGFTTASVVAAVVSMFVAWNSFSSNATAILSTVYAYYYPVAQFDTEWNNATAGSSLLCVYMAVGFGFMSLLSIMLLERRNGLCCRTTNVQRPFHNGESPALLEAEGQPSDMANTTIQAPQNYAGEAV